MKSVFLSFIKILIEVCICSIPKLLHPYFLKYEFHLQGRFSNIKEAMLFLKMVKLKERKLKYYLNSKLKNYEKANHLGIKVRRLQQLKSEYKKTGEIPKLIKTRRPKTELTEEYKQLIDKALKESKLGNAVTLRLYITKYYGKVLPRNKIHKYLLKKGISREDEKKKKQRTYNLYNRKHSFSLVHLDWHESKCIPGKQVCVVEDDATRLIISGNEFDNALEEYNIKLVEEAIIKIFSEYSATIKQCNTDKGPQFYANKKDLEGEKGLCLFEKFLFDKGICHIPSRRNHPQTNGKNERWFRTYEENRLKFKSFKEFIDWYNNKIHLGLSRTEGVTPKEAVMNKLQPTSLVGLFFRRIK